ncbi:dynein heavy chain and region D6 of dynein motor-domain-containing protein [Cladochytrium replicatum]|nr:dynein heavy chain and region D6 of dynein motor-domain-containing protein [Cladochytrium replicatum]
MSRSDDPFAFIKYLQHHPYSTEFVYMQPKKDSTGNFNPYNLQIASYGSLDKRADYFTLSGTGVTHFDANRHGQFTPLNQWQREYQLFHSLIKIPFFARYRVWKGFTQWRKTVRAIKVNLSKKQLSKNLFFAHPILCGALLQMRANCVDVITRHRLITSINIEHDGKKILSTGFKLTHFVSEQKQWLNQEADSLLELLNNMRTIAEKAAIQCLEKKGFLVESDDRIQKSEEAVSAPPEQKMMTFTERAARRRECGRLQRFVKLCDYMIINMLHFLAVESARDLLKHVQNGCTDSDVVVDQENSGFLVLGGQEPDQSGRDKTEKSISLQSMNEELSQSLYTGGGVQVGGVVVGNEVGTRDLVNCGFEGFPTLMCAIHRKNFQKVSLVELVYDERVSSAKVAKIQQVEDSIAPKLKEDSKNNTNPSKSQNTNSDSFQPLFRTELLLNQKSSSKNLYFSPSLPEFLAAIDIILKLFISTLEKFNLFTNSFDFLNPAYTASGGSNNAGSSAVRMLDEFEFGEGPQIASIVQEGEYFKEVCGRIRGSLVGIFRNATTWMLRWKDVHEMWIENEQFKVLESLEAACGDIAVLFATSTGPVQGVEGGLAQLLIQHQKEKEQKIAELVSNTDQHISVDDQKYDIFTLASTIAVRSDGTSFSPLTEFFENLLGKFASQKLIMNQIPQMSIINNLLIDSSELKNILVPSPECCFQGVAKILPGLAHDKNELLLGEVQTWVRVLNTQPVSVEGFVEYLGWLEKVRDSMMLVESFYDEVTRLYNLTDQYRIPIQPTDLALYQTLGPTLRQLKEAVDMATDTKDENTSKFSSELERAMSDLMAEVSDIRNRAQDPMVLNPNAKAVLVIRFLEDLQDQLRKIEGFRTRYELWGDLFRNGGSVASMQSKTTAAGTSKETGGVNMGQSKSPELEETKTEVDLKLLLWVSLRDWETLSEAWNAAQFETLNTEEINGTITTYLKTVYNLDKGLPPNDVVPKLKGLVDSYRSMYPTIVDLRNPALRPRHWEKIQDSIGKALVKDETFTLGKLIELRIFDFKEEIGSISSQAGSEASLEEMLGKVVKAWSELEFIVLNYRDNKDVFILGAVDDIQAQLEDSQVTIATVKGSRFIGPIKSEVERWDKMLSLFAETLDATLICQRNWLYLESIFSAPDIQRQLPDEARMFSQVDRSWKDVMRKIYRNPNAIKSGTMPGLLEIMQQNNILLDQIQKCLEDYLESKRLLFPRFYFLSNDELLEILSQTRNPQAVQPHLSKCFDAIKSLEFSSSDPKSIDIVAMNSPEGERVAFTKTIKARGNVEAWLGSVEEAMVSVLRRLIKTALGEYEEIKRNDWVKEHVGQIVVTGNQILWTRDVSDCLKTMDPLKALEALKSKSIQNLSQVAGLVRGDLTKIQRGILGALITIDVHNRDILSGLIVSKVRGLNNFDWTKQMRYYWDMDSDTCNVKMSNSTFNYGYEYLGCSPRLVITPLTDRCYLTLTGAMQLNLGGSPVGPAGTGKTETVKDLAKALAKQCVVFNCSDGLDYKMMGKMFAGLAQSGAWCCFDEFNRIDIEVLSVIAQQLLSIKNAKDMKATKFMFEGREIRLIDTCCAFITMNPGYAGRTELPDNLKALFRPIAMMIPDYGLIAEIILFSEGFEQAKSLSGKVVNLYKLCVEQLSQQDHYDFGMRAVKSVLIMAGALKRSAPELTEEVVLIRSLRDSNLPKFIAEDIGLFKGILDDLFPSIVVTEKDYGLLVSTMKERIQERHLDIIDTFVTRICQLYETMKIRHGVMLVGPTGGGKTSCYEILQESMNRLAEKHPSSDHQKVKTWVLNPKCVSMTELYGEFNLATMEWKDGLIGYIFRQQVAENSLDEKWTVCDGPVDALWIENMNTVLDDNKLLTLINGERIKMNNTMHMLFEVADLAVASPATVSRCGMVYMDPTNLGWKPFVNSWARKLPKFVPNELKELFLGLCDTYMGLGLKYIRKFCKESIPSVDLNLVASTCNLIYTFINRKEIDFTQNICDLKILFSHLFVFCYVWGVGGNLADGNQENFDTFVHDLFEQKSIPDVQLPSSNNIFCYFVDIKSKTFCLWDDLVPQFKYSSETPYFQMIVPTPDTVKYSYLLEALLTNGYPTLFTGNTGVGKSVIIQDLMDKICKKNLFVPVVLNFSGQTTSAQTQHYMEHKLEKKRKNILGAPSGMNKIVLFVDDLNMPKLDTYGAQPPIELIRQYIDCGGFYDREKLTWKIIQDIEIIAACAPPGGGRNIVTSRLLRRFNMLNIPAPNEMALAKIFRSIVEGFLKPFSAEVRSSGEGIVGSSIEIYQRMCSELLPTPAKSHYTFNLRDLSRVIQGVLQVKSTIVQSKGELVKLFCHESARVFQDRLIDESDRMYFNNLLSEVVEKNFAVSIAKESFVQKPIIFGDFLKRGVPPEERLYTEMTDMKVLNTLLEEYLEEYNVTFSKEIRLIFFMDAKQHITRISRIIRQPRGNALLVGVGGTGKQSLTRLGCHISDFQCHQIELTRTYGETEWREDIKKLYRSAGLEGKNTVFLLTDTQIKNETFLEDINGILNSGEVPNLFDFDERERILGELRHVAREKEMSEDRDSIYQLFINRVRDNLHIVFATSPVGDTFRNRCRMFPSLVNSSTIDWFDEWPRDALLSVSQRFFEFVDLGSDEMRQKISEMCVEIHSTVGELAVLYYAELRRRYYTTPTSYLELINLYISMLQEKRKEQGSQRDRLKNGLNKLAETNELVAKMQIELEQLGPELKQKAQDVEVLMVKIAKDQEIADGVRKVVSEEEAIVREKATQTEAIAEEAQKDLDEALPALQAAYKALDSLEKKDIAELKVFTKPPELVLMVLEAICIFFKVKPDWENSKKLLSDPQLMRKMAEYDKDNIPEVITKKLKKYIDNPNFNPEAVEKVSKACRSMSMWVIALDLYSRVFKEVQPKRRRLEEAQATLEATRAKLAEKTAALQEVEVQLEKLKSKYETSVSSKKQLSEKMEETTRRLARASRLTTALADEQIRWSESVEYLNQLIESLVGNIFLSAAAVAYYGAFTSNYRQELIVRWSKRCNELGIPISDNFSLFENLADPAVVRDWNIQGLPADPLSIENGILVTRGRRWPLMIDPQGQANRWIRNMEGLELKAIKLTEAKFLRSLENAIRTGLPVLLEDVGEHLDPALEPLLLKQTVRQGGRLLIKLGDTFVEYDRNFKLYITTKLPNPHYLPEVCIKVTIINFTVTKMGLEGQLLADVVKREKPELEEQRNTLIINIANDKKQLKDIEEKILKLLFNSQGNILDDEELINTLNQSKITSAAIKERVTQAEQTEREINIAREKYRPVAIRGSVLYFVVADLAEIDSMYQFSLKYFKNLFNLCIQEAEKSDDLQKRINILCKNITYTIFTNISRGLFEQHKMLYSFMICSEILKEQKSISSIEWSFFIRGVGISNRDLPPKPNVKWLTTNMWRNCCDLADTLVNFSYMKEHMTMYTSDWEAIVESDNPFLETIPGGQNAENISLFQKLLLLKVLREEKLVPSVVEFVRQNLGVEYIDIAPLDLAKAYKDTNSQTPFIFILSSGSDPVSALMKFASSKEINMQDRLHMISLGQGQGPIAEDLVRRAMNSGDWVFLQNCHLAASWMNRLESIVKEFSSSDSQIDPNFRLFLSSMPSKVFPIAVLQEGVKVTNEPPKGLRANLARSFADVSKDLFDEHPPQGVKFKKLLFGVCFFNAIIHERKKFGPLGWNIHYDWSNSDLEVAITIVRNILLEQKTIPWDALLYLTGEITFGGRVTDDWDRRTLKSMLSKYYTPLILDNGYKFSSSGIYYAPPDADLQVFREYIESLPFTEDPSVFGMHENANISFQIQETRKLIKTLLDVQPRIVSTSGGQSSEESVIQAATSILEEWPNQILLEIPADEKEALNGLVAAVLFKKDKSGRMLNSLSTVLSQEVVRFNKLLGIVKASLQTLIKAVKGLVVMSAELDLVFNSLVNNEVPSLWANAAYPSLKPLGAWVKDLIKRIEFVSQWAETGQPQSFWLSGFFFPQGFLTGVLQNHARLHHIPIDTLTFSFYFTEMEDLEFLAGSRPPTVQAVKSVSQLATDASSDGVLIRGLYIEGARWDREKSLLQDPFPMEMFSSLPLVRFAPSQTPQDSQHLYVAPLYKTSARAGTLLSTGHSTNFVLSVNIPSDKPQDFWIAKGVALLVSILFTASYCLKTYFVQK